MLLSSTYFPAGCLVFSTAVDAVTLLLYPEVVLFKMSEDVKSVSL